MTHVTSNSLNVALIGAGRIGAIRADALAHRVPQARLVAITDAMPGAAERLAARVGQARVCATVREVLDDETVDAVFVSTPTSTHADIIAAAAAAGKHLFVEKPVALNLDEVDRALAAVARAGVRLQIGLNRRFDPTFARVRQAIVDGTVGDVHLLHIISRDPAPPPISYVVSSGGLFADMTIHDLDMARFLVGSEVTSIYARGGVLVSEEIGQAGDIDTAMLMLTFANGALGTIENSRRAVYGYDQRVEILGSQGGISTDNMYPNEVTISTASAVQRDLPLNFFLERYAESYVRETAAFVAMVLAGGTPSPDGRDGRIALQLAMAARASLLSGEPVAIDAG